MRSVETHVRRSGFHHSARYLILFFSEADGMLTLGERMLSLVDGCIVLIPPDSPYSFAYGSRCRYYRLSFEPANEEMTALFRTMYEKRFNIIHLALDRRRESIHFQAEQIYNMQQQGDDGPGGYRKIHQTACITKLILDVFALQEQLGQKSSYNTHQLLAMQLTTYLDENYLSAITLEQLEKVFFLSRFHLCRLFRGQMKMSIFEYIHWKKTQHASGLLANTDASITDICYESGFGNMQSFYTIFKRHTQKTPLQYRKSKEGDS